MTSTTTNKISPEVRARAVRLVLDYEAEHASQPSCRKQINALAVWTSVCWFEGFKTTLF